VMPGESTVVSDHTLSTCLGAFEAFQAARLDFTHEIAKLAVKAN